MSAMEARFISQITSLTARITALENPPLQALHPTSLGRTPTAAEVDYETIDLDDHRPFFGEAAQNRFMVNEEAKTGGWYCKLCKKQDHMGNHLLSSSHAKKYASWLWEKKRMYPEKFQDPIYDDHKKDAQDPAPALQHAPPVPTHSLPNGQATLALTDGKEGPQTAAASDPWGSYDPSGASHDNDSHSHQTPWTDSWASGWAKTSWSNKHWGLGE